MDSVWTSIKAAVDVNPWRAAAIAIAGAAVFVAREKEILPFDVPALALWIIGVVAIFAAAIALVDLLRAAVAGTTAVVSWAHQRWLGRKLRKQILRGLDTLSGREKQIFGYLLARNERSFVGASDGGYAQTLIAKDLIKRPAQIGSNFDMAFVIPEFVWNELQRRKAEFPDTHTGKALPWRRPLI